MKKYLKKLNPREKRLLSLGVVAVTIALIYRFYWEPLAQWEDRERRVLERNLQMRDDMLLYAKQQNFVSIKALDGDIESTLKLQAEKEGITLSNVKMSDNGASFNITIVSAEALWRWLAFLETNYDIQTTEITVVADGGNGNVSVAHAHVQALSGNR